MKSKLLSLLLSAAIAFGLWLYVVTVVDPEYEASYYDVPVVFDGAVQLNDRDLIITSGTDTTVDLRLLGNRADLKKLDKTNITILADLSQITQPGEHNVRYSISYPSSAGAIDVLNQDPQYITIQVSQRIRREVPVRVEYIGSLPESFIADVQNAVLDHTFVSVSGPQEVVEQIEYASIQVDLSGRMETIVESQKHTLCGKDGKPIEDVSAVTVNVSDIRLTVRVYQVKELPLILQIEDSGGITQDMVTVTPDRTSITVSGSRAALEGLDHIVLGTIRLGDLGEGTVQLRFDIELPEGVTNESGFSQVLVDVKMPEMDTKIYRITQFRVVGVPEGMYVQVKNQAIQIRIRGPVELLEKLETAMIVATVDCSNQILLENSHNTLRLTITIPGMEGVGPAGEYTVLVYVGTETVPEG